MTMTDAISAAARAAAGHLAAEYGPGLAADVEAALHAREIAQRPAQYLDPVSLGSLIVAIATLAWTIYADQRKKTPEPPPGPVARHVRAELRQHSSSTTSQQETDRITEIVVTEIIQAARDPR
jgi:uncharacterized membrane protein YebE (DUF533 family)